MDVSTSTISSPAASLSTNASTAPSQNSPLLSAAVPFTTIDELFYQINQAPGDILTVIGVSATTFDAIYKARESRGRRFRFRRFLASSKILIITIPTKLHEQLHLALYRKADRQIERIGLEPSWCSTGSATFREQGHPNGDGGEGDSTGGPRQQCKAGHWPTLIIEAGDSQTLAELRNDMRWWFSRSNHQVKIVILAKFDHHLNQIILEKWIETEAQPRPGATRTRAAASLIPCRSQEITITQDPNSTSYTVTSGALRLEFDLLFLRQPGQGEGDIIISIEDLQEYAGRVWDWV